MSARRHPQPGHPRSNFESLLRTLCAALSWVGPGALERWKPLARGEEAAAERVQ
jgi:hypothetical protein